jgi:hypothetical protein
LHEFVDTQYRPNGMRNNKHGMEKVATIPNTVNMMLCSVSRRMAKEWWTKEWRRQCFPLIPVSQIPLSNIWLASDWLLAGGVLSRSLPQPALD